MEKNNALQLLMPLADAVQFSLFLCGSKKHDVLTIKGHEDFGLPINDDKEIVFKCKVVASGVEPSGAYVLLNMVGDLLVLVSYDRAMKELCMCVVDGAVIGHPNSYVNERTVKGIYEKALPAIRGMWIRAIDQEQWSRLDDITGMDEAAMGVVEEKLRADHSAVQG